MIKLYFDKFKFNFPITCDGKYLYFIHIPKTAGISISYILYNQEIGHNKISELLIRYGNSIDKFKFFAIIRNPLDRLISSLNYLPQSKYADDIIFYNNHKNLIDNFMAINASDFHQLASYFHFQKQVEYIKCNNFDIDLTLFKYENLEHIVDWEHWPINDSLPKLNVTPHKNTSTAKHALDSLESFTREFYKDDWLLWENL